MAIEFININESKPYKEFVGFYKKASKLKQKYIEAVSISSYNSEINEVDCRFVNLKYINNNQWIFFTNYNSPKAHDFDSHNQITAIFFWDSLNVQIRIKALIKKTSKIFSDNHFKERVHEKNALAISSNQSKEIKSYKDIVKNFDEICSKNKSLQHRPEYWGGYAFKPYYFEFWEGHDLRLNKRNAYKYKNKRWIHTILQP